MKTAIVGYTGFVGSNLCISHQFEGCYNSKNIESAFGTNPDLLVYSGVRAEMFLANKFPEEDMKIIENAIENIKKINPKNVVLISTISVNEPELPYGRNRLYLEEWIEQNYKDSLIVRLPALFGKGIKKNFIFDMINIIPSLLVEEKYNQLLKGTSFSDEYILQDNGFYKCITTDIEKRKKLKQFFKEKGFTALNFTDSRSVYQFFNLTYLWNLIQTALNNKINKFTITSEPLSAAEVYEYVFGENFINEIKSNYPLQDFKEPLANIFGGSNGYIYTKEAVLNDIKNFVEEESL